jgi:DNA-binding CsgD family transcriptional regulator
MSHNLSLNSLQLRTFARAVGELDDFKSLKDLIETAFRTLQLFAPGSLICFERLRLSGDFYELTLSDYDSRSANIDILMELIAHHPYMLYLKQGGTKLAVRPTDLIATEEWEKHPLFNELYMPNNIPFSMFSRVFVHKMSYNYNFSILRDRCFTDEEQALTRIYLEEMRRIFDRLHSQSPVAEQEIRKNGHSMGLSNREMEVMILVAKGKPNKDIAMDLGNSHRTVNNILNSVFKKLKVHTRGEAAHLLGMSQAPIERTSVLG